MKFIPIKTRIIRPPKDEIWDILDNLKIRDGDIVFITSKILAIHQGRCVPCRAEDKEELIRRESSHHLPYVTRGGFRCNLTITDNILIANAGIDESNADNHYILWPKNVDELCREIRAHLCKKNNIKNLGVISTDSHTTPLRWGVMGITTGLSGIEPLRDLRGTPDIFGRKTQIARVNIIDALSAMAVLMMGECAEQTPIVILRGYGDIVFNPLADMSSFKIAPEDDLFEPILRTITKTSAKS